MSHASLSVIQASNRPRDLEIWWVAHPDRWPLAPKGHYIGPDGRLLSPGEFAAYAADPARLIFVFRGPDPQRLSPPGA